MLADTDNDWVLVSERTLGLKVIFSASLLRQLLCAESCISRRLHSCHVFAHFTGKCSIKWGFCFHFISYRTMRTCFFRHFSQFKSNSIERTLKGPLPPVLKEMRNIPEMKTWLKIYLTFVVRAEVGVSLIIRSCLGWTISKAWLTPIFAAKESFRKPSYQDFEFQSAGIHLWWKPCKTNLITCSWDVHHAGCRPATHHSLGPGEMLDLDPPDLIAGSVTVLLQNKLPFILPVCWPFFHMYS